VVREPPLVFGTVVDGEMRLNEYGREVAACWGWLEERHPYVCLDQWVVMPDHLHGIIVVVGGSAVPTKRKPLGRLIGAFKTVSTRRINGMRSTPGAKLWQRGYYEHIVRDDRSLRRVRAYIANNPSQWALDLRKPGRG
jgi:REP element-mobilizing transposase RayT